MAVSTSPSVAARLALAAAVALGALAGACTEAPLGGAEQAVISDQDHGGVPGFVFLPPVVPPPASYGDFVPTVTPVVIAEQLDRDGAVLRTLATYTRTAPAVERVRVHLQGDLPDDGDPDPAGYFVVRFRSADFPVAGGDVVRFRVLVDERELGWADVKVLDQRRDRRLIDRSQYGFVVAGRTLRVKFRIDREALVAGPDGDGDGVPDASDVCPQTYDPDQADTVGDGTGDACRCDAVVCEPSRAGCAIAGCEPTTGACGPERCVEDHPAILSGHVIGAQLGPLPDAAVTVTGDTGSHSVHPDVDGAFTIQVPYAESELTISRAGFATHTMHLSFGPDELAEGYVFVLQPVLAWFDLTVWQGVGQPLPGASVIVDFDDGTTAGGITDALGELHLSLLPVGSAFTVRATSPGGVEGEYHGGGLAAGSNTLIMGLY